MAKINNKEREKKRTQPPQLAVLAPARPLASHHDIIIALFLFFLLVHLVLLRCYTSLVLLQRTALSRSIKGSHRIASLYPIYTTLPPFRSRSIHPSINTIKTT
ncbi:hypothetical protein VTH06DRAFT_5925 [Thermothelomyces fergusii]